MLDHNGQRVTEAGPSTPVEIFGLSGVPEPGTLFVVVAEEARRARSPSIRQSKQREGELQKSAAASRCRILSERMKAGEVKELKVIIKGDVQGSVEALADSLARLSTAEVKIEVLHSSAGAISETDVTLASASNARDPRLQHPARAQSRGAGREGRRRDSPLHGDLRSDQRDARGDGRAARADLPRKVAGPRRGAQDLQRPRRHDRGLAWWSTAR